MSNFSPVRIAVLASQNAPGLEVLLGDPNRGRLYNLAGVIGSEFTFDQSAALDAAHIPLVMHPFAQFQHERNLSTRNLHAREEYDEATAEQLRRLNADYVILCGYRYVITDPLLAAYEMRMLALHDADLTLLDDDGARRYTGSHAVADALLDGQNETRTTMYFVTRDIGCGPVFLLSDPFPVAPLAIDARAWGDAYLLTQYAQLHRRWMLRAAWGTMLIKAVEYIALGTVQIIRGMAWIDGVPGPCRMGHSPAICTEREPSIRRALPATCPLIQQ
jgi:phosphoribosylglycinamide formyltransferase 1